MRAAHLNLAVQASRGKELRISMVVETRFRRIHSGILAAFVRTPPWAVHWAASQGMSAALCSLRSRA